MASDLRERLQASLGNTYSIERELAGAGMSRVFVARETSLGRQVVVKVLPPELVAGVNVDRFKREIQVAARLQHPHIVPVLSAGEFEGLPFYTMPLVDGSSVRARSPAARFRSRRPSTSCGMSHVRSRTRTVESDEGLRRELGVLRGFGPIGSDRWAAQLNSPVSRLVSTTSSYQRPSCEWAPVH